MYSYIYLPISSSLVLDITQMLLKISIKFVHASCNVLFSSFISPILGVAGTSAGVGFAIPSSTVIKIVPQLIQFGRVSIDAKH